MFEIDFLIGGGKKVIYVALTDVDFSFCSPKPEFYDDKITFCPLLSRDTFFAESVIKTRKTAINLRARLKVNFFLTRGRACDVKVCRENNFKLPRQNPSDN